MKKIKLNGNEFLFISEDGLDGPIATKEQYESFRESYAFLYKDGLIRRHGEVIGQRTDIEFLEGEVLK